MTNKKLTFAVLTSVAGSIFLMINRCGLKVTGSPVIVVASNATPHLQIGGAIKVGVKNSERSLTENRESFKKRIIVDTLLSSQALIFSPISFRLESACVKALGLTESETNKINANLRQFVANIALKEKALAKKIETSDGPCLRIDPHRELESYRESFARSCDEVFKDAEASNKFAAAVAGKSALGTFGTSVEEFFVRDEKIDGKIRTCLITRVEKNGAMREVRKQFYNEGDFSRAGVILGNSNAIAGLDKQYIDPVVAKNLIQQMQKRAEALKKETEVKK